MGPGPKKVSGKPVFYLRHFWRDLIEQSLIAIRTAETEGRRLNKRRVSIKFTDAHRIDGDFIKWMQQRIDEAGDYAAEKKRLYQELGFEGGYGNAKMRFAEHSRDDIFKEFLGLGAGLRISEFEYIPERFAIPDLTRKISETTGVVRITPQPQGACEIRFRSSPTEPAFSVDGTYFTVPFAPHAPVRVSAPPAELLLDKDKVDLKMSIRPGERMSLASWHIYSTIKTMALRGPLQVEIWRANRKLSTEILIDRKTGAKLDWVAIHELTKTLKSIADMRRISDVWFSLPEINSNISDLGYLFQGNAASLRMTCESDIPLKPGVTSFVYYSVADLAGWTFGHLVQRTVREDRIHGDRRILTADTVRIVEAYAFKDAGGEERQLMQSDYETLLRTLEESENPLGFGEFGTYVREMLANHE